MVVQGREKKNEIRQNAAQTAVVKDNVEKAERLVDKQQTYLDEAIRQRDMTLSGAQLVCKCSELEASEKTF